MSQYAGYMGKIALLDLCTQTVTDYKWSDEDRLRTLGGRAMAAKILSDLLKGKETALSEENPIVIATGPLTGTGAPSSNHFTLASLSPATGAVSYASCGGEFGYWLKKAGYDGLVIKGKCSEPTWIKISNSSFTFNSAKKLMGLKVSDTQDELQFMLDEERGCRVKCGKLVIGPAGENLSRLATVVSGDREAERGDLGAVFGWKLLKGIVVTGNKEIPVFDLEQARANHKEWSKIIHDHPLTGELLPKYGTMGFVGYLNEQGMLPAMGYAKGAYSYADEIGGECFTEKYNVVNRGCAFCPIRCERTVLLDGRLVRGPELETTVLLGSGILNSDPCRVAVWNNEMFELGLDPVLTARVIVWAMEANEAGVYKCGLCYGIASNVSDFIENIAYCDGAGAELSAGLAALGKKYGEDFAYLTKPLELVAVDRIMGVSLNAKGDPKQKALVDFADELQEAAASAGQCRMCAFADIPAFVVTEPDSFASAAVKAVMPLSSGIFKLLSKMPTKLTDKLPHFVHSKELRASLDMKLSLSDFVAVGKAGLATEAELNKKLGAEVKSVYMPASIAASQKEAEKSFAEKLTEKLKSSALLLKLKKEE